MKTFKVTSSASTISPFTSPQRVFKSRHTSRRSPPSSRKTHNPLITRAGFLDFLNPAAASTTKKGSKGRAQEIVTLLLDITEGTEGGIKASNQRREEIAELVEELESYCIRSPLRSELIFGTWEVVYASKPQTAGGPFRSPIGRTVFPGQRAIQIIEPPNVCINEVSFKTLGFIPGTARQEGEIEPLNETTFQLTFPDLDNKRVGGPPQRVIETLYLDERVRVARAVPQNEDQEASFYVFRRSDEDEDVEEEEEEEEEVVVAKKPVAVRKTAPSRQAPPPSPPSPPSTSNNKPAFEFPQLFGARKGGMATQAERAYAAKGQKSSTASGTQKKAPVAVAQQRGTVRKTTVAVSTTTSGTAVRKTREQLAAERAAAKAAAEEERRLAREQAIAAKAAAEEERRLAKERALAERAAAEERRRKEREEAEQERQRVRAAAEAERAAAEERRAASRQQFQEATAAANEASNEARDAVAAFKSAEKEAAPLFKQASQAEALIQQAVAAAESAAAALKAAQVEEVDAEKVVLEKQRLVNELQKRLRQQAEALAPKIAKKK